MLAFYVRLMVLISIISNDVSQRVTDTKTGWPWSALSHSHLCWIWPCHWELPRQCHHNICGMSTIPQKLADQSRPRQSDSHLVPSNSISANYASSRVPTSHFHTGHRSNLRRKPHYRSIPHIHPNSNALEIESEALEKGRSHYCAQFGCLHSCLCYY